MDDLHSQFNQLELKLLEILEYNKNLELKIEKLNTELRNQHSYNQKLYAKIHQLEEENKKLKVVSAFSGNEEYKKVMKLQLNKLIKEIDLCITQIKSS